MGILGRILSWLKGLFRQDEIVTILPVQPAPVVALDLPEIPDEPKPWVEMRCGVCDHDVLFYLNVTLAEVNPYKATILVSACEHCSTRWAAVIPSVQFAAADSLVLTEEDLIHDGYTD